MTTSNRLKSCFNWLITGLNLSIHAFKQIRPPVMVQRQCMPTAELELHCYRDKEKYSFFHLDIALL